MAEAIKKKRKLYRIAHQQKRKKTRQLTNLQRRMQRKLLPKLRRPKVKGLVICWTRRMVGRMFSE